MVFREYSLLSACETGANPPRNTEISAKVLNMPDTVAPRPSRRVLYCLNCVKKLTTEVKSARQVLATTFCQRDNAGAKCDPYRVDIGNYNYDDIPAEFNRALNVLVHLQQQAALPAHDDEGKQRREDRVHDYAKKIVLAVQGWQKVLAANVKKDKDWLAHRRASYDENKRRFDEGLGSVGLLTPTNEEVDAELEQTLLHQWKGNKNWWYLRVVWFGQVT
jgi:hypothetical protein